MVAGFHHSVVATHVATEAGGFLGHSSEPGAEIAQGDGYMRLPGSMSMVVPTDHPIIAIDRETASLHFWTNPPGFWACTVQ